MGKALLIVIFGCVITLTMTNTKFITGINDGILNAVDSYTDTEARNIGNSMVNILLTDIAADPSYRKSSETVQHILDGTARYRIVDTILVPGDTLIKIEVKVKYYDFSHTITAYTKDADPLGWVPPFIRGAWTANAILNNTISDMYIDGRNYDLSLNIVPGTGTYGVSSSVDFVNVENAAIGGTYDSLDYPMTFPENPDIIEKYDWGGKFPESPDEILGYPEGTLKGIAQTGVHGSQYVLNPKKIEDELDFPLSGVTFVELTDGKERELKMFGMGNSGILVVHGPDASSRLKGVKLDPDKEKKLKAGKVHVCHKPGTPAEHTLTISSAALGAHLDHGDYEGKCPSNDNWFEGLIITDYSFHHHLDILGAILQLSPDLETKKNCEGNEDHWAKFSRQAIENATLITAEATELHGNSDKSKYNETGFGTGRHKALHWLE